MISHPPPATIPTPYSFNRQISRQSYCTHYFCFLKNLHLILVGLLPLLPDITVDTVITLLQNPVVTLFPLSYVTYKKYSKQLTIFSSLKCSFLWVSRRTLIQVLFLPHFLKVSFALAFPLNGIFSGLISCFSFLYILCLSDPIYPNGLTFQTSVNISNISV